MKKGIWFDLLKLLVLFGAVWTFFYFVPLFPDTPALKFSIETEEKLGDLIVEEILKRNPECTEINNPALDSAMQIISSQLMENIGLTDYQYKIRVIDNPEVNAFTLPGGNIFILSGLIKFAEYPEEVAAVLSHEMGHVEKRHTVSNLVRELGLTIITGILTSGDPAVITEISKTLLSAKFSREQEEEADQFGLNLMVQSDISPQAMATFFRRLEREKGTYNKELEMLMTHPNVNSRIKASIEYDTPADFKPVEFDLDWSKVKESVGEVKE